MKPILLKSSKGFTLIELIVVIALIGIMATFAVPKFNITFFDNDLNSTTRWFISNVPSLKEKVKATRANCLLNINMDINQLWITTETMSEEELAEAEEKAYQFPEGIIISDISFPDKEIISGGIASIYFYSNGYSDKAVIHIEGDGRKLSVIIEPFLANVQIEEGHINLDG